jgi:hypothetical protein
LANWWRSFSVGLSSSVAALIDHLISESCSQVWTNIQSSQSHNQTRKLACFCVFVHINPLVWNVHVSVSCPSLSTQFLKYFWFS